jgi:very-short-patch-repair endonuclease
MEYLYYEYFDLLDTSDEKFKLFLEQIVHPYIRINKVEQKQYVKIINDYIIIDGFELQEYQYISNHPVYRVVKTRGGVDGDVKNIIFAANGPKPEIVLTDSINNNIEIKRNKKFCLVYNYPVRSSGLRWIDLVSWWRDINNIDNPKKDDEHELYSRLFESLDSEPEKLFFRSYFEGFHNKLNKTLPALIPQVYLHYDPYTIKQLEGNKRIPRQRMDFLLLFSTSDRIVIEVDGKQHYSQNNIAKPQKYSEMVSADRDLRLNGYEIYRFGGFELQGKYGVKTVKKFFEKLLKKYNIF